MPHPLGVGGVDADPQNSVFGQPGHRAKFGSFSCNGWNVEIADVQSRDNHAVHRARNNEIN